MSFLDAPIHLNDLPEAEQTDFSPIPDGSYNVTIKEASLSPTKDGTGQYIKLRLDVLGPTHSGRVLFSNVNIRNKSSQAENIGRQQLASIMKAVGLATINDTDQLIGAELSVKVGTRPASGDYAAQNEIKSYNPASGASQTSAIPAMQSAGQPGKATPPWAKQ